MQKQWIVEWQRGSVAVFRVGGDDSVRLEKLAAIEYGEGVQAEEALNKALRHAQVGKGSVRFVLARELIEFGVVQIPQVDAVDVPDVIRFQAQRHFSNVTELWTIDYALMPKLDTQDLQDALVGAISSVTMDAITKACDAVGATIERVTLRPLELASFVSKTRSGSSASELCVCIADQHIELLVFRFGQVVQVRGTKLPSETAQRQSVVRGEITRTLIATAPYLAGAPIESATVISTQSNLTELVPVVEKAISGVVHKVDIETFIGSDVSFPVEVATVEQSIDEQAPSQIGVGDIVHRIVAALGAAQISAHRDRIINFSDPKRRPPPQNKTRLYVIAASAAVLLLGLGAFWYYGQLGALEAERADLQAQLDGSKDLVKAAQTKIGHLTEVEAFLDRSTNWLDELTYISERLPTSDKAILRSASFTTGLNGVAVITMPMFADESTTIVKLEQALSDANHKVSGQMSSQLDTPVDQYRWGVTEKIEVVGSGWDLEKALTSTGSTTNSKPNEATDSSVKANEATEQP